MARQPRSSKHTLARKSFLAALPFSFGVALGFLLGVTPVGGYTEPPDPSYTAEEFQPFIVSDPLRPNDHPDLLVGALSPYPVVTEPPASPPIRQAKPKAKPKAQVTYRLPSGAYKPWRTFNANVTAARAYALNRLGARQFNCLDRLFTRESNWRVHAENKRSGAYGIPQALPGKKMASMGDDWRDNATTQVRWGIRYVNVRYGSACNALAHSYRTGWY